jgi:MFS family permease
LLRSLAGLFTAGLVPATLSSVGDLAVENQHARWIGVVNGDAAVGWVIGPSIGGVLYDNFGYIVSLAVSIVSELSAFFLALFQISETYSPSRRSSGIRLGWRSVWKTFSTLPAFILIMIISFGAMFAYAFVEPQFMFYAYKNLVWTPAQLGLIMGFFGAAFMFGEFALGQLGDHHGRKPVIVLGLTIFSAQFIGLAIFRDTARIAVSFILVRLGNALYDPAWNALLLDNASSEHTARVMGMKSMAGSLGLMLGPALVVLLTPSLSPQFVFMLSFILLLMLTLASAFDLRSSQKKERMSAVSNATVPR